MTSWEVIRRGDQWGLYVRDYAVQGVPPNYIWFKNISEETARWLVEEKLAGDLYGELNANRV
jgi:hypothetical protein